ncbi:Phosphatidylglycerol/phosphatidylinositol transfer protein [Tyrophagus putrescentiae]|nr:Phosphatidylglycerol/phosphatidylinositol transfer protein [Tyrophagus putrescentiae]WCD24718.1 Tyr p 2 allergen [Tyrophagus putrescentiae]
MKFLIVLSALVAIAAAGQVKFHDCGKGEVSSVAVDGCSGDSCVIYKSKPVHVLAEFTANQDTAKAEMQVTGTLNGLEVPIPGVETDGCKFVKCPLKKGTKYTFDYTFHIPSVVPTIKSTLTLKSTGEHGPLACGSVSGELKP